MWSRVVVQQDLRTPTGPFAVRFCTGFTLQAVRFSFMPREKSKIIVDILNFHWLPLPGYGQPKHTDELGFVWIQD